jgi:hypothetical protein
MSPGDICIIGKLLLVGWLMAATPAMGRAQLWHLDGRAGDADRPESPILLAVKGATAVGTYAMSGESASRPIPAVVFEDGDRRWLAAILPAIPARKAFSYQLRPTDATSANGVRFRPSGANLDVMLDDHLLTTYQPDSWSKPIFFPVIGPTGEPFTRFYPMQDVAGEDRDHPHQRSFWFTHGSVNGVDFWSEDRPGTPAEKRTKGTIRETNRQEIVQGPVLARLRTGDDWLAPDGRRICHDRRTTTFYRSPSIRIIDFEIDIRASDGPVTFGDTKEGMFGLRVASSMDVKRKTGGTITNAEGLTDDRAWGKASPWVDYVGPVKDQTVGIAILNHPDSFRFPTTWHVRDYGLFAANPFGWKDFGRPDRGDFTLPGGETLHFAYRIILHRGDTASLYAPGHFRAYSRPPELSIRE